jgi:N-acetylglucosaminyldiphosphoundecaprenol N-acetyl-beta-D-mannosaminyltransferase
VLGVQVSTLSLQESADQMLEWAHDESSSLPRIVCATSVHGIIEAREDPAFKAILNRAALVTPDGVPLVWVGRLSGCSTMERVYGPSLTRRVCELSAGRGTRHYFYGGAPGVAEELACRLATESPGLRVAGTYSPPFRELTPAELGEVAARINAARADIVWVGLSTPKQERWADSVRGLLEARVVATVGAAFDFHAGRLRQAPAWMQQHGLEWLFRLSQEPRRLWRRYAHNNPRFAVLAVRQLLGIGRPD